MDIGRSNPGQFWCQFFGCNIDVYCLSGPTLQDVVRRYAILTGKSPMPPLWALGYHQCCWGYQCEADFRELARQFAAVDIPVSAFWYNIDWHMTLTLN